MPVQDAARRPADPADASGGDRPHCFANPSPAAARVARANVSAPNPEA